MHTKQRTAGSIVESPLSQQFYSQKHAVEHPRLIQIKKKTKINWQFQALIVDQLIILFNLHIKEKKQRKY